MSHRRFEQVLLVAFSILATLRTALAQAPPPESSGGRPIQPLPGHSAAPSVDAASSAQPVDAASSAQPVDAPSARAPAPPTAAAAERATPPSPPENATAELAKAQSFDELEASLESRPNSTESTEAAPNLPASAPGRGGGSAAALNPEISAILDVAAAYFSEDEPLQSGGHDPTKTGFNWQQLELALGAVADPYLRFDANLVFSPFGVEVEEAYATTLDLPAGFQARFGQFLTRFGRFNATHPHSWNFADQPFELGRLFGSEGERGLGVEGSVLLPTPWVVELVASATDAANESTARSFFGAQDLGVESPGDLLYTTAIKQFFPLTPDWSLALGTSANFGPNSTGRDNRTEIYGADLYVKYRPLAVPEPPVVSLQSEWFYRRRQLPGESLQDYGEFTELLYRFALRWAVAARHELGSPSYDALGRAVLDPLDPDWTQTRQRLGVSLSFHPTEFTRFRVQGSRDMPGYREAIWATFLTAEVVVGAHGAHKF